MSKRTFTDYTLDYVEGWKGRSKIIIDGFNKIQSLIDTKYQDSNLRVTYIKEKYGGLRFECYGGNDELSGMLWEIENESYTVCDTCGEKGKLRDDLGRIRTLCNKHYKEIK